MDINRILVGILFLGFCSCSSPSPDAGTEPAMDIMYHAGDMPTEDWEFLPYPAHFGQIGDFQVFLISKAPRPGDRRSILPIGMLTTLEGGVEQQWIVANDAHPDFQIEGLLTIDDLMTNHNGIKSTLERWIMNRKGIGKVMMKGWNEVPSLEDSNNQ